LTIGSARKCAIIKEFKQEKLAPKITGEENGEKLHLKLLSNDGAIYDVSEAWVRDYRGQIVPKSIFINLDFTGKAIQSTCLLAKVMNFLNISSLDEFVGKEVLVEPKDNGFMAIVAYT